VSGFLKTKYDNQTIFIHSASPEVLYDAEEEYRAMLYEGRFQADWLTDKQILGILIKNGMWAETGDEDLKKIATKIEDIKLELFNNHLNLNKITVYRKELRRVEATYDGMLNTRYGFTIYTLEGFASMVKSQTILIKTVFGMGGANFWSGRDVSFAEVDKIADLVHKNRISIGQFRYTARTEPWRSYWQGTNHNPFPDIMKITEEQKNIVAFSKMYDSIHQHPECPTDEVINDDDMMDGWLIKQRRKSESERVAADVNTTLLKGKGMDKASEIFVVAGSKEEAARINNLNDMQGQVAKAQRSQVIKTLGTATDDKFPDKRLELSNKAKEMFKQTHGKG
jgi:hypothetical protein